MIGDQLNSGTSNINKTSQDRKGLFTTRQVDQTTKQAVSVSQIRQSRQKIELDVVRLHNRIQLLEAEEERANKIIEDTKNKVKQIMKSRAANEQFKKELSKTRDLDLKKKQAQVRKRMNSKLPSMIGTQQTTSMPNSPLNSNSMMAMNQNQLADGSALIASDIKQSSQPTIRENNLSNQDLVKAQEIP